MGQEETLDRYTDALLGSTFGELRRARMADLPSDAVRLPDAASIPSAIAQALLEIFRFRDAALPQRPLADPLDYELLRSYLRSGETIAATYYGPLSFNSLGQNVGREATTMQVYGGRARAVLPVFEQRNYSLSYPAPAAVGCAATGGTATYAESACALCAPSRCESGLSTSELLLLLLLVLLSVALGIAAFGKMRQIQGRQRLLLVCGTGRPPPLKKPPGCKYHLFLSHTWANGQDQCGKIKSQLRISVPTARVFLDVDDLRDISKLETYVDESTTVLLFLSKGYFKSLNCRREVKAWAAATQDKGLILVHETAPTHGGVTLEHLRAECPADLAPRIFSDANLERIIPFYRQERVWAQSLQQIAAIMAMHTVWANEVCKSPRPMRRSTGLTLQPPQTTRTRLRSSLARKAALLRLSTDSVSSQTSVASEASVQAGPKLPQLYYANESPYSRGPCSLELPAVLYTTEDNPGAVAVALQLRRAVLNLSIIFGSKKRGGGAAFRSVISAKIDGSSALRFDKSDAALTETFAHLDADSSGTISVQEMSAHIASVYGGAMDESVVHDLFVLADTDGDGEVSLAEFMAIMRAGPDIKPSRPNRPSSRGAAGATSRSDAVEDPSLSGVTHFLLLLNRQTFVGERGKRLAQTLRGALGLPSPNERRGGSAPTAEETRLESEQNLLMACSQLKSELDVFKLSTHSDSPSRGMSNLDTPAKTTNKRWNRNTRWMGAAGGRNSGGSSSVDLGARPPRGHLGDLGARLAGAGEAPRSSIKLLLVHAVDAQNGGCEFDEFFAVTPSDLVQNGQLFHQPAVPLFSSPAFRAVSLELMVAQQHGRRCSFSQRTMLRPPTTLQTPAHILRAALWAPEDSSASWMRKLGCGGALVPAQRCRCCRF